MNRSRLLMVVALVLIIVATIGGAGIYLLSSGMLGGGGGGGSAGEPTSAPIEVTATPESFLNVLVAAQDLPRGVPIPTEAIAVYPWPTQIVPLNAVTDPATIVGTRARISIDRGMPLLSSMVVSSLAQLSPTGSDAAAQIPPGFQAISLPYLKNQGVSMGLRDGDHVNVIVSWWVVDIDQNFQTLLPNLSNSLNPPTAGDPATGAPAGLVASVPELHSVPSAASGPVGRGETDTTTGQDLYLAPSEPQRGRLVVQSVIQDALVLHLGDFGRSLFPTLMPPTPTVGPDTPPPPPEAPTETPTPPETLTLVVNPQDALVLDYVQKMLAKYPDSIQFTFTLRSAGDSSRVETDSVTLQYMFERFNITLPPKLPYGPFVPAP